MAAKKTTQPESFESAMSELEQIVQQLERGELPLTEALNAFQQGIKLSQFCQNTLNEAQATVAKIMTPKGEALLDNEGDA